MSDDDVMLNAGYSPVNDDDLMSACAELRAAIYRPSSIPSQEERA